MDDDHIMSKLKMPLEMSVAFLSLASVISMETDFEISNLYDSDSFDIETKLIILPSVCL